MHYKKLIHLFIYIFAIIGFFFVLVFIGMKTGLTNAWSKVDNQQANFLNTAGVGVATTLYPTHTWSEREEWKIFESAVKKDQKIINEAGTKAGISPRLIMSVLAVEQLRLFHSERALFEEVFSPLKILVIQSQFSWGVMGIKRETAIEIEDRDERGILRFQTGDIEKERFERLTNDKDRSWSYLYAGVYMKELMDEWNKAGYPIDNKPGIIATLYNLGFEKSVPKENPQIGGAVIDFGGNKYTFGALAHDVYYSDMLLEEFPR